MPVSVIAPDGTSVWQMNLAYVAIDPDKNEAAIRLLNQQYVEINPDKQVELVWVDSEIQIWPYPEGASKQLPMVTDRVLIDGDGTWGIYPERI